MKRVLHNESYSDRILKMTADTMLLIDSNGVCVDIVVNTVKHWFLSDELIGKNILQVLPEETRKEVIPEFNKVLKEGVMSVKNYVLKTSRGETFYFKSILYPFDGMVLCQYRDITARQKDKLLLKQYSSILGAVIENLPARIVVKDASNDFRFIYRNKKSIKEDKSPSYYVGKNDFDIHSLKTATENRAEDIQVLTTGEPIHKTIEIPDRQGEIHIYDKLKLRLQEDSSHPMLLSIEWDITEMERMKRELMAAKEKAESSDKLKSAFLANMSHEIRTPLNAIVGFSRVIAETANEEERKSYYEVVEANNERLLNLINEILDLSKIEAGTVEFTFGDVNLEDLCEDLLAAHKFRCPAGVNLACVDSPRGVVTRTDKNRLFQVISNLIGNAFKFTTKGTVSFGYEIIDQNIRFFVRDTGAGIAPAKLGSVFNRFVKANENVQGTGLGLSICKTIVERLEGTIWVESEVDKGTTFFFTLPYTVPAGHQTITSELLQKQKNTSKTIIQENHKILVAEDIDENFEVVKLILNNSYTLIRAVDGIEVIALLEKRSPELILMDIKMPNLDGLSATQIIRESGNDIPIIALSAYASNEDKEMALAAGCNDFLTKPIQKEALEQAIQKLL